MVPRSISLSWGPCNLRFRFGQNEGRQTPDFGRGQSHFRCAKIGTVPKLFSGRPLRRSEGLPAESSSLL
jgi:hypothetical protein